MRRFEAVSEIFARAGSIFSTRCHSGPAIFHDSGGFCSEYSSPVGAEVVGRPDERSASYGRIAGERPSLESDLSGIVFGSESLPELVSSFDGGSVSVIRCPETRVSEEKSSAICGSIRAYQSPLADARAKPASKWQIEGTAQKPHEWHRCFELFRGCQQKL